MITNRYDSLFLGQKVKEIWRKLKDCHRDALRRQGKRKSGDAAKAIKLWTY